MKNKEKKNLEDFSLPQLGILLKHLCLGKNHLKNLLTHHQLTDLFTWCDLNENQKKQISANKIEKFGNMSLIINTILTSTFGAWMGLSGCIGYGLGSFKTLMIISGIAFFLSGFIGYMSLKMTKNQARDAIHNYLLHKFQLRVLKTINQKIEEKNKSVIFYLNTAVFILENKKEESFDKNHLNCFRNITEAYQWFEQLIKVLHNRLQDVQALLSVEIYQQQIDQTTNLIKKTLAKHVHFLDNLAFSKQQEKKRVFIRPTLPFLKVLTNPSFGVPKYQAFFSSSWIKSHFNQLLLGVIPTIWGGFASMFVFVGGIPNIARELNFIGLSAMLTTPFARLIEISLATLITCYFAFSFLYSSKKSWQRQKLVEQIGKEIANEDTHLLANDHRLTMLFKVKMHTQKLISIFNVIKKIDNHTLQQSQEQVETSLSLEKLPF